jgi:hypothetical protein
MIIGGFFSHQLQIGGGKRSFVIVQTADAALWLVHNPSVRHFGAPRAHNTL